MDALLRPPQLLCSAAGLPRQRQRGRRQSHGVHAFAAADGLPEGKRLYTVLADRSATDNPALTHSAMSSPSVGTKGRELGHEAALA